MVKGEQKCVQDYEKAYYQLLSDLRLDEREACSEEVYPFNLLYCLHPDGFSEGFPSDIRGTVEYVLCTMLTPRECAAVRLRFQDRKRFCEIGDAIGVKEKRAKQIIASAMRRLRHPIRSRLLRIGMEAYRAEFGEAKYQEGFTKALKEARRLVFDMNNVEPCLIKCTQPAARSSIAKFGLNDSIDNLDFSVRVWNSLRHAEINTIGELLAVPDAASLLKIRNLGRKCVKEIVSRLSENGFDAAHLSIDESSLSDAGSKEREDSLDCSQVNFV